MADFSVNATDLAAPQGAGSTVVTPVQAAKETSALSGSVINEIGDYFVKGLQAQRKQDLLDKQNAVVNSYVDAENTISSGLLQGSLTAAMAGAMSRANFRKHAAGNAQFIDELNKAAGALKGNSEIGDAEAEIKAERDRKYADLSQAATAGYVIPPNSSEELKSSIVAAHKSTIRAKADTDALYRKQDQDMQLGRYNAEVAKREAEETAFQTTNMLAGSHLESFQSLSKDLRAQVTSGKMNPEEAAHYLTSQYNNISAALYAGARTNPQYATHFKTVFDDAFKLGQQMLDPKADIAKLENEYNRRVMTLQLAASNDPKVFGAVVANKMFGNNPATALTVSKESIRALSLLSGVNIGSKDFVPAVIGDPNAEEGVLKVLKGALSDLKGGKIAEPDLVKAQASNSINQMLKQTGELLDKGADPKQLKGIAAFCASSEYGEFAKNGTLDPQALGACQKTFEMSYTPAIIDGVQKKLEKVLPRGLAAGGGASLVGRKEDAKVADTVDIKFTGSGIVFEPLNKQGLTGSEYRAAALEIENLKSAQAGINQLIHIAAHMDGSTDYQKYWEENKHRWIPGYFLEGLKPGDVMNGYRFNGGSARSPSNYTKVDNASK
jgi:hypothetical protein